MHLLLGSFVAFAGVVASLPTSGTPNVGPTSGHYPSRLPVVSQVHLDGLQRFLNALHYLLLVVVLHFGRAVPSFPGTLQHTILPGRLEKFPWSASG